MLLSSLDPISSSHKNVFNNLPDNPVAQITGAKVFMAPMSGITDMPFRQILQKFGCRIAFTEMVDANALFYSNRKTTPMLETGFNDITIAAQIVGSDTEKIIFAAKICEERGFNILELNAGCPAKKVIKDGKGSALLKDPRKLGKILCALIKEIKIPLTLKIRSGWDENTINYPETARIAEAEGVRAICIHPRTKTQMYRGTPDHEITRAIKKSIKIPVFASGNIFSPDNVIDVFQRTNCDAIAVARGALGRPWIFRQIYERLSGIPQSPEPSFIEIKNIISQHVSLCVEFHGEKRAFPRMHKHIQWYLKKYKNRSVIALEYTKIKSLDKFKLFIEHLILDEYNQLSLSNT